MFQFFFAEIALKLNNKKEFAKNKKIGFV